MKPPAGKTQLSWSKLHLNYRFGSFFEVPEIRLHWERFQIAWRQGAKTAISTSSMCTTKGGQSSTEKKNKPHGGLRS